MSDHGFDDEFVALLEGARDAVHETESQIRLKRPELGRHRPVRALAGDLVGEVRRAGYLHPFDLRSARRDVAAPSRGVPLKAGLAER